MHLLVRGFQIMIKPPVVAFFLFLSIPSVWAADLTLNLTNMSGEEINAVTATPKGAAEISTQNILASSIPAGEPGTATLQAADDECVFDLIFSFASGKTLARPDTDICQTDGIVVE